MVAALADVSWMFTAEGTVPTVAVGVGVAVPVDVALAVGVAPGVPIKLMIPCPPSGADDQPGPTKM